MSFKILKILNYFQILHFFKVPINEDQIKQKGQCNIFGINNDYKGNFTNLDGLFVVKIKTPEELCFKSFLKKQKYSVDFFSIRVSLFYIHCFELKITTSFPKLILFLPP